MVILAPGSKLSHGGSTITGLRCTSNTEATLRLPFASLLHGLRQRGRMAPGVMQGQKRAPIGQRDRIVERARPVERGASAHAPSFGSSTADGTPNRSQADREITAVRREKPDRLAVPRHRPPVGRRPVQLGGRRDHRIRSLVGLGLKVMV